MVDALAPRCDEGRGKLRKASGSGTHTLIRRCPNGETHQFSGTQKWIHSFCEQTRGSETSQYPQENKSTEIPLVVASERGTV